MLQTLPAPGKVDQGGRMMDGPPQVPKTGFLLEKHTN